METMYESALPQVVQKRRASDRVVALAGNPNVGKSTIFNALTGMKQHTGNWPGKTVSSAQGYCQRHGQGYVLVDVPGCYSLLAHSAEEEVARDVLCFDHPDAVIVVCDATCLERNLNLALQILEATPHVVVCVNLMDEARRKNIRVDLKLLSRRLGVPVVGTAARSKRGLDHLIDALGGAFGAPSTQVARVQYPAYLEEPLVREIEPAVRRVCGDRLDARWVGVRLLDGNASILQSLSERLGFDITAAPEIAAALRSVRADLAQQEISPQKVSDDIAGACVQTAERLCKGVILCEDGYARRDRRLDRLFTSKATGFPIMFLLLLAVFWITISGANYPSQLLSSGLSWVENQLAVFLTGAGAPAAAVDLVAHGVFRVLAWVISVMLPPMAIFFPLFTLLEDFGYLPRVAFNMDRAFHHCHACGKQALTMCMGFGCNAVGVTGCRIIDSPRERLIAILTNVFVPCNGRFPTIISLLTMFLIGGLAGLFSSVLSAVLLIAVIALGVAVTLAVSRLLSGTLLKGVPSSFALELPPYRTPQVGKVIVRSVVDRTLHVLARAVVAAAPAGLLIWVMANVSVGGETLLAHCAGFLDPFARLMGLDGVILLAFILGFPANEIVIPIVLMAYTAQGGLFSIDNLAVLRDLLVSNGWTWTTAVSVILFSLMHWPCATTCLTIRRETGSWKWTLLAIALPTAIGIGACMLFHLVVCLFSLA